MGVFSSPSPPPPPPPPPLIKILVGAIYTFPGAKKNNVVLIPTLWAIPPTSRHVATGGGGGRVPPKNKQTNKKSRIGWGNLTIHTCRVLDCWRHINIFTFNMLKRGLNPTVERLNPSCFQNVVTPLVFRFAFIAEENMNFNFFMADVYLAYYENWVRNLDIKMCPYDF